METTPAQTGQPTGMVNPVVAPKRKWVRRIVLLVVIILLVVLGFNYRYLIKIDHPVYAGESVLFVQNLNPVTVDRSESVTGSFQLMNGSVTGGKRVLQVRSQKDSFTMGCTWENDFRNWVTIPGGNGVYYLDQVGEPVRDNQSSLLAGHCGYPNRIFVSSTDHLDKFSVLYDATSTESGIVEYGWSTDGKSLALLLLDKKGAFRIELVDVQKKSSRVLKKNVDLARLDLEFVYFSSSDNVIATFASELKEAMLGGTLQVLDTRDGSTINEITFPKNKIFKNIAINNTLDRLYVSALVLTSTQIGADNTVFYIHEFGYINLLGEEKGKFVKVSDNDFGYSATSPDNKRVYLQQYRGDPNTDTEEIKHYILDVDTGVLKQVMKDYQSGFDYYGIKYPWSPSGRYIWLAAQGGNNSAKADRGAHVLDYIYDVDKDKLTPINRIKNKRLNGDVTGIFKIPKAMAIQIDYLFEIDQPYIYYLGWVKR